MAEYLTTDDVSAYTKGRLSASDPETARALDAALAKCRAWCGWHVSPIMVTQHKLNGTGMGCLFLPSLRIVSVESVKIDGEDIDPATVLFSDDSPGMLIRADGATWPCGVGNIEVEIQHGYSAAEAADFREAVLCLIDDTSLQIGTGRTGPLTDKEVDDVRLSWAGRFTSTIEQSLLDKATLSRYRIISLY